MKIATTLRSIAAIATMTTIAACGGGGSSSGTTGQLTIGLTDGPVEFAEGVYVAFTGIELKPAGGPPMDPIYFDENSCDDFDAATGTCMIELLQLAGSERRVVFSEQVEAGEYNWIRLLVDADLNEMDSYIEIRNQDETLTQCPLWIPSGSQTGLKIVSGVTVTTNGRSDFTLDFDVRKSVTAPPGLSIGSVEACAQNYILKPAIRIVDTTTVGGIAGSIPAPVAEDASSSPLTDESCVDDDEDGVIDNIAVYIFENFEGDAVADDIYDQMASGNPVTTAGVTFDADANEYVYEAGFLLAPEDYLAALTCTADVDMPDADEFDPSSAELQDFSFVAERGVSTQVDTTVDGSF